MVDVKTLPVNKQFTRRLIRPDSWVINCYDPNQAAPHPHVIIGSDKAAVIDPTWTRLPLREYVETCVTDKPLIVLCSHSHHDHTNANWMFNDLPIYMSAYAWQEIQERRKLSDEEGKWMGHPHGDYVPRLLKPGDTLDLGGRVIEVLPYEGCHSPGSLIYLDHKYHLLFTGDEIECGQILIGGGPGRRSTASVEKLRDNLNNILEGWGKEIDMVCPPHNGSPFDVHFLKYLVENCERIMAGKEGIDDVGSMSYLYNPLEDRSEEQIRRTLEDPDLKRSEWKGTSIVYRTDHIFRAQVDA
jgi:glyoxylase-like metal-dependent hydrolase (beta-lactamase superfamily II)